MLIEKYGNDIPQSHKKQQSMISVENNLSEQAFPEPDKPPYYYVKKDEWKPLPENWAVTLEKVIQDNRCPRMVTCAYNGRGKILLKFRQKGGENSFSDTFTVHGINRYLGKLKEDMFFPPITLYPSGRTGTGKGMTIIFADLAPYPIHGFLDVNKTEYTVLIKVSVP